MIEPAGDLGLPVETLAVLLVLGQLQRQDLDGHGALEARVACPVDLAHAPCPEGCEDLVRPETLTG